MTRLELRNLALFWLDDENAEYFTETNVNNLLDNALRELQKLLIQAGESYYVICAESSTVINQRDYALPSDFLKINRLERITQGSGDTANTERLRPMTRNELEIGRYNNGATSQGLPFNYVINKNTFSLYPIPNESKVLRLWYSYRVIDMATDGTSPDAPEEFHEYIAIMAARDGFLKDGRSLVPIESKLGYYEKLLEEMSENRNVDSPRMVVATESGFGAF